MSAISVSSNVDDFAAFANPAASASTGSDFAQNSHQSYHRQLGVAGGRNPSRQRPSPGYQPHERAPPDHSTPVSGTTTRVNGAQSAHKPMAATSFQRARTYSAVDGSLQMNGSVHLTRQSTDTSSTGITSRSPRLGSKPTRIPKASRGPSGNHTSASVPTSPLMNGTAVNGVSPLSSHTTPTQSSSPYAPVPAETRPFHFPSSHSSHANLGPSQPSRIINEPAPFSTASSSSSIYEISGPVGELGNHRPQDSVGSMESNSSAEKPFEHWYRGEVSRNGGVGELRIGRRQEMLEIANYGHAINNKRKAIANRRAALQALEEHRVLTVSRKRADSLAGINSRMRQRESLYLDDIIDQGELAARLGRVLDEDPLTDLESGDGSDLGSISHNSRQQWRFSNHDSDYDFIPGVGDITTTGLSMSGHTDTSTHSPPTSYEAGARTVTPTPSAIEPQCPPRTTTPTQKPKSRRGSSASRIPTFSSERKSSESRTSTPTISNSNKSQLQHGVVDLTPTPSSPHIPPPTSLPSATTPGRKALNSFSSVPSSTPSSSSHNHIKRGVSPGPRAATTATAPPSTPSSSSRNKRGISPGPHAATAPGSAAKRARTGVGPKSPKPTVKPSKPRSAVKKSTSISRTPGDSRRSSAQYPSPGGDDDDGMDMADAIPSWTQPKPGEGNWDDVR
jgi:hypothetical protein